MAYTLELVRKLTMKNNAWHLSRTDGPPVPMGTIEQARMTLCEEVRCRTADGSGTLFTIEARTIVELASTYDVSAGDGTPIGVAVDSFMNR